MWFKELPRIPLGTQHPCAATLGPTLTVPFTAHSATCPSLLSCLCQGLKNTSDSQAGHVAYWLSCLLGRPHADWGAWPAPIKRGPWETGMATYAHVTDSCHRVGD